jgi:tetratricopeptide (TPR) repeat protein
VRADRLPQAASLLSRALELAPEQRRWRTTLGALLIALRRLPEAKQELERVVREDPSSALARYYLADVQKRLGDLKPAEENARRAVELMPRGFEEAWLDRLEYPPLVNALHLLAEITAGRGDDPEALLRQALELEPTHSGAHYLLARHLRARGLSVEADQELDRFRKARRAEELVALALNLSRFAGNRPQAEIELRRALHVHPDHPRALYLLAIELLQDGRKAEAAGLLRRCLEIRPKARPLIEPLLDRLKR